MSLEKKIEITSNDDIAQQSTEEKLANLGYDLADTRSSEMSKEGAFVLSVYLKNTARTLGSACVVAMRESMARLRGNVKQYGNSRADFKRFVHAYRASLLKIFLLIVLVLAVVLSAVWYVTNDNKYEIEPDVVRYYAGQTYLVDEGSVLVRGIDQTTLRSGDGSESVMPSIALYSQSSDTIILPEDMVYYDPRTITIGAVDALSVIRYSNEGILLESGNESTYLSKGFLFDGADYYLFLEDVTLSFNGYTIELSALSYVEVVYQNYLVVFNYETKESFLEETPSSITATAQGDEYTINVLNDSLERYNADKILLFTRPEVVSSIFE